jgi:hypothetical protein
VKTGRVFYFCTLANLAAPISSRIERTALSGETAGFSEIREITLSPIIYTRITMRERLGVRTRGWMNSLDLSSFSLNLGPEWQESGPSN